MDENRNPDQGEHAIYRTTGTNIVPGVEFDLSLSFLAAKIKRETQSVTYFLSEKEKHAKEK